MDIVRLIKDAHQNAIDKGFYDCPECKGTGEGISSNISAFDVYVPDCKHCKGSGIDPNKNIGELLMLIVSELGEALEAHRNGRFFKNIDPDYSLEEIALDICKYGKRVQSSAIEQFEEDIKDTFEDEIADVFIRLFDLCGYKGWELEELDAKIPYSTYDNIGESLLMLCHTTAHIKNNAYDINDLFKMLKQFCDFKNIPIEKHIEAKMAYNKTREHKHGKAY